MVSRALLACIALGCALAAPSVAARSTDTPACAVSLKPSPPGSVHVDVAGRPLKLGAVDGAVDELRVYPAGADAVLVATAGRGDNGPHGSATLWKLGCQGGAAQVVASIADADFGHAALAPDGRSLFFSAGDGLFALDLATGRPRRLTTATSPACRKNQVPARDVIVGPMDGDVLAFERGCGYEHEWHAVAMTLRNPGSSGASAHGARALAARPAVASAVALGAAGWVWLGAGRCDDATAPPRVLVSSDNGAHWRVAELKTPTPQPPRALIADRTAPGAAIVFTASCGTSQHVDPAWVYLTEDGGASFHAMAVPPGIPAAADGGPASEQDPIRAITAPDGTLARLVLYGDSSQVLGDQVARWESRDLGRTWSPLPPVATSPALTPNEALAPGSDGGATIRQGGVWRWHAKGEAGTRIYPR